MASLLDLEKHLRGLFNQGSQAVGNAVQNFQQPRQNITSQNFRPIIPQQKIEAVKQAWNRPVPQIDPLGRYRPQINQFAKRVANIPSATEIGRKTNPMVKILFPQSNNPISYAGQDFVLDNIRSFGRAIDTSTPESFSKNLDRLSFVPMGSVAAKGTSRAIRIAKELDNAKGARTSIQRNLTKAIENIPDLPVDFGNLNKKTKVQINNILIKAGQKPIQDDSVKVYPNVIKNEFRNKRMKEGLSPKTISDIAYSVLHGRPKVLPGRYPQTVKLLKVKPNKGSINTGIIGEFKGGASLKSVYPNTKLKDRLLEGGAKDPSSGLMDASQSPFSAAQKSIDNIISQREPGSYQMWDDFRQGKLKDVMTSKPVKVKFNEPLSSDAIVKNGKVRIVSKPTATEIKNRAEVAYGNPDLYTQRKVKLDEAFGPSEPFPWEQGKPVAQAATDVATQRMAEANTVLGNEGRGGFAGLDNEVRDAFQLWVNSRNASKVEGFIRKKDFVDLDNLGMDGIFAFQKGEKVGNFSAVKKFFDDKRAEVIKKTGEDFGYKQDYLPQIWDNTDEEIQRVFGNRLSKKSPFMLKSLIKDYQEGVNLGLKPRFQTISDLAGWYEEKANKLIADHEFFSYLSKNGFIGTSGKSQPGWKSLDPDRFPKIKVNVDGQTYSGAYQAPPELADIINNYLRDPQVKWLETIANYVSRVKNIALNFGIPWTGVNAHGINILSRHSLMGTGGNPVSRFLTGAKFMLHPNSAMKSLDDAMVGAPKAVKDGLTLSAEDYLGLGNQAESKVGHITRFGKKWENVFGVPLFNKMIPALKLSSYEELVKNGMNGKDAAKLVNNVYGGINWEQMGRSRDLQNLFRSMILAPDWAETTLRLGGNMARAMNPLHKSAVANRYRMMMATILASYVAHNIVNKLSSGHYSYENSPGHTFEIEAGYTSDGEKRYIRPYGTGLDFVRLPFDVIKGLAEGDISTVARIVRNRLSIPAGVVVGFATDTDYRGQSIGYSGTDKFGNEIPLGERASNIGSEALSLIGLPSFSKQFYKSATGQQGWEQGLTQGFELPFRYSNTGNSNLQKQVANLAEGKTGKELYDFNQSLVGQNKLTDNQLALVQQQGQGALSEIISNRVKNSDAEKVKESVKETGQGQVSGDKYYYYENGQTKSIDLNFEVEQPKLSGQPNLDKELVKNYKSSITTKQNNIEKLFAQGVISAEEAEAKWLELQALKDGAGGGAGKGFKAKAITVKRVSPVKVNFSSSSFKKSTPKKIALSKAPVITKAKKPKTIKISTPVASRSYKIVGPSNVKGLANSVKLV